MLLWGRGLGLWVLRPLLLLVVVVVSYCGEAVVGVLGIRKRRCWVFVCGKFEELVD